MFHQVKENANQLPNKVKQDIDKSIKRYAEKKINQMEVAEIKTSTGQIQSE